MAPQVWTLEKAPGGGGRTAQYRLTRKRSLLELPPGLGGGSSKAPRRFVSLAAVQGASGGGAAGRRLWAALDSGHLLQLRGGSGKVERALDTQVR